MLGGYAYTAEIAHHNLVDEVLSGQKIFNSMRAGIAPLRIMLVDSLAERLEVLAGTLGAAGHRVVARLDHGADLHAEVLRVEPDVVIIAMDAADRDILEDMHAINRERPRPILVFTQDDNPDFIRAAVKAGVSAYVVGDLDPQRVQPVLNVAIARFEQFQVLQRELLDARTALADRKVIERAKGILMKQRGIDEETAYNALRSMAMARNLKLVDVAHNVLAAAELLT
ncbi:MAG: ANTAR domain-containing response regulator [Gammaproteobacteria bacterium]